MDWGRGFTGPLSHRPSIGFMIVHVNRLAYKFCLIGQISLITKNELTAKVKVLFFCTNLFGHKLVCVCFKIYFLAYICFCLSCLNLDIWSFSKKKENKKTSQLQLLQLQFKPEYKIIKNIFSLLILNIRYYK